MADPSQNLEWLTISCTLPLAIDYDMEFAPSGSTPIILVSGDNYFKTIDIPEAYKPKNINLI